MKNLSIIIAAILIIAAVIYLFRPQPIDNTHYRRQIDSLTTIAQQLRHQLNTLEGERDTIEIHIHHTRTIRDTVLIETAKLPADEQLMKFDSLTGAFVPSQLTERRVLTDTNRISVALLCLVEIPYLRTEIELQEVIIANLDNQIAVKDSMYEVRGVKLGVCGKKVEELERNLRRQKTRNWLVISGLVVAVVALI